MERFDTIVVGAGKAGLAAAYQLKRAGVTFVVLDADERVGDVWRRRWDSLRLFTTARYSALPGMPLPIPSSSHATKDQVADYLEAYVQRFDLPVRTGVRVSRLEQVDGTFLVTAGDSTFEADRVIVATGAHHDPRTPAVARSPRGGRRRRASSARGRLDRPRGERVWCTGFRQDLSWIRIPVFDEEGEVRHVRGLATDAPGLGFVGLPFQYAFASEALPGMNRDARFVVKRLLAARRGDAEEASLVTPADTAA